MKNKKYLFINLSLILFRKILIILFYLLFLKSKTDIKLMAIILDEIPIYLNLEGFIVEIIFIVYGYFDYSTIFMFYILFTIIYCITQIKKNNPKNKLMLTFTIIHIIMLLIYFYSYFLRLYFMPIKI